MVKSFIQQQYQETLEYLYRRLPMFERIGPPAFKKDLSNILSLCAFLGDPHKQFKSIHIAGTNGKGSVSHLLASILQESGYRTGLYVSPHYKDFRERIRINGQFISKQYLIDQVEQLKPVIEEIRPSFFEITVALAFDYFAKKKVNVAVIETGLGGRLDSTNIITPLLSVITNISLDHQNILGDTLAKIAFEKAGIMKPGTPCLIGEYKKVSYGVFKQRAKELGIPLSCADKLSKTAKTGMDTFKFQDKKKATPVHLFRSRLSGSYQEKNINTVLNAVKILNQKKLFVISDTGVQSGFDRLVHNAPLIGRWHWLSRKPDILADAAHNLAGLEILFNEINKLQQGQLHCVFGTVSDKDIEPVLARLPESAIYYFVAADLPRALPADILCEKAIGFNLKGKAYGKVSHGLRAAKKAMKPNDFVLITGSIFVVAEVI
ncbi:MAG: folylpolyglutamate synthase/dihydrofolate synthase family protein [Saprospiraceae bacterium]|nr:folylpolyglutamate synthase/dihydrofolate synthase family protein [Saprospiraceae bacterium]